MKTRVYVGGMTPLGQGGDGWMEWAVSNEGVASVYRSEESKVMLSIYCLVYIPTLTYSYEVYITAERTRSWKQVAEMSFVH